MQNKLKYKTELYFFIFLIILIFFLYHQNLRAFFVSDDFDWITASQNRSLASFFTANFEGKIGGGNYCPMVNCVYFFANKIGGLNPLFYHLFSILLHFGNAILVYYIAKHFLGKKIAFFSSLFFAVYFNHSEAVAWIASIPHIGASFFYLLSLWLWIKYQHKKSVLLIIASLMSFLCALLFKEIALTLPAVLFLLYAIEKQRGNKKNEAEKNSFFAKPQNILKNNFNFLICLFLYFLILFLYLIIRYKTTGIAFGYYGNKTFNFSLKFYAENWIKFFVSLFSTNIFRMKLKIFVSNHLKLIIAIIAIIFACGGIWLKKYFKIYLLSALLFLAASSIYIPLLMNPLNNEGERYLYLPSVLFCVFISLFLASLLKKYLKILFVIFIFLILCSSYILYQKNRLWFLGGQISKKIIADFPKTVDMNKSDAKIVFLYLPDNISGAQIFRNAIQKAIHLYYPDYNIDAIVLPIYIMLQPTNWNKNLLVWKSDGDNRILGKILNQEKIITGYDRREDKNFIFELWGYDYDYSNTNTIFIKIKDDFIKSTQNQKIYFLYFNEGGLRELDKELVQ